MVPSSVQSALYLSASVISNKQLIQGSRVSSFTSLLPVWSASLTRELKRIKGVLRAFTLGDITVHEAPAPLLWEFMGSSLTLTKTGKFTGR